MARTCKDIALGDTVTSAMAGRAELAETCVAKPNQVAAADKIEDALRPNGTTASPPRRAAEGLAPGTKIGRFMVVEPLGQGGMGTVYAAYDADLDRKIAVKLLRADSLAEHQRHRARNRLLREARAMASLADANVLTIHEVGTYADRVFIAMEFAAGGTIRQWHEREEPSWREVVDRFIAAGRGLAAAHAAGMVHRDFKPDNILIGGDGQVKVADFGLVSTVAVQTSFANESASLRLPPSTPLSVSLTQTGTLLGTPTYMAPEQLRNRPATALSDQFAFCVSLYELLYGQRPFSDRSFDELSRSVCSGVIKNPPRRSEVPGWLHRVLICGMARRPEDRFEDMETLLEALSTDPDARAIAQRRRRRHRAWWAAIAAASAVLATLAAVKLTGASDSTCARPDQSIAEVWNEEVDNRLRTSFAATGRGHATATAGLVADNVDTYLERWQQTHVDACQDNRRGTQSAQLLDLRMSCLDQRKRELAALLALFAGADGAMVDRAVQAVRALPSPSHCSDAESLLLTTPLPEDQHTRSRLAELKERQAQHLALRRAGRYAEALTIAEAVLAEARAIGFEPAIAQALHDVGDLHYSLSHAGAEATLEEAFVSADRANLDSVRADAATLLASVVAEGKGRTIDGLRWGRIAEAIAARLPNRIEHEAFLYDAMGRIHDFSGDQAEAISNYEKALQRWQALANGDGIRMAHTLNNLGMVLCAQGDRDAARAHVERALAIWTEELGPHHPDVSLALHNLGMIHHESGQLDLATEHYRRALAIVEAGLGPNHPSVAETLNNLGNALHESGKTDEALTLYHRALAIYAAIPNAAAGARGITYGNIASAYLDNHDVANAATHFDLALASKREDFGDIHPSVAHTLSQLAFMAESRGETESALAHLEQAREICLAKDCAAYLTPEIDFALARLLPRRERARAGQLAAKARAAFAALPAAEHAQAIADIDAWLAAR